MKSKKRISSFRLSEQEHDYLYDIAEFLGVSKTDAFRFLIRRFIRQDMKNAF